MAQDPLLGYVLAGEYRIIRFVAEESLGRVYQAQIEKTGLAVSVKVLHPHLVDNAEVFGRWGREMLATAAIEHPNTVRMIDFGEHRIFHYIVLEYITARTLQVELEQHQHLPYARVAHIAAQIGSALASAHAEGIVHRNLAPINILLLNNSEGGDFVKIRDFGLSRLQDPDVDDGDLTAMGSRVGTTAYMAPEYIDQALVHPKGDVYALGCLMYEMLVGEPPFVGNAGVVMEMHIDATPPQPGDMTDGVPDWMNDTILAMLEKDTKMRPNAADIVHAMEGGMGASLGPPRLIETNSAQPSTVEMPNAAPRTAKSGGAAAAVAGIGIAGIAAIVLLLTLVLGGLVILLMMG